MKKYIAVLVLVTMGLLAGAQLKSPSELSAAKNKSLGKKLLKKGATEMAVSYLEVAAEKKPRNKKIQALLAPAQLEIRNYAAAEKHFSDLIIKDKKGKRPEWLYYKARALQHQEKYEEAIALFNQFRKSATDDKYSDMIKWSKSAAEGCRLGLNQQDSTRKKEHRCVRLENGINTVYDEQSVAFYDGKLLLFSRWDNRLNFSGKKLLGYAERSSLHYAERLEKSWKIQGVYSSLSENNEGVYLTTPSFSDDGRTLYFSLCKEELPLQLRCDIYKSDLENGNWKKAEKLNNSINLPTANNIWPHEGRAPGGEECLYFSSNRNPGKGYDLFYAIRNSDGSFQRAKTLGAPINTKSDEIAPYYDYETNTLYYSSNGLIGLGGFDVFAAKRLVIGDFLDPENMGTPINSGADDYGFVFNTKINTGFLVSNRQSVSNDACTTCNDDIWLIESSKIFPAVKGEVLKWSKGLKQFVSNGTVALFNLTDNVQAAYAQTSYSGAFFFDVEPDKDYKLIVATEGYAQQERTFSTKGWMRSDTLKISFVLDSIPAAKDLTGLKIATVYWDYDKFQLTSTAPDSLKKVVDFYFQHPQYVIEVGSHTDSKGDDVYNLKLSQKRGEAVIRYLLSKKIPAKNIFNNPYGESRPIAPNNTPDGKDFPEGRAMNRRTEFVVFEVLKK
jgi:outer membrane protein OmpA-like peptidoglycan-associated protein